MLHLKGSQCCRLIRDKLQCDFNVTVLQDHLYSDVVIVNEAQQQFMVQLVIPTPTPHRVSVLIVAPSCSS